MNLWEIFGWITQSAEILVLEEKMIIKIWDKNGLKIIERTYDCENFSLATGRGGFIAKDTILEVRNEPIPKIRWSDRGRFGRTAGRDFWREIDPLL